MRYWTGKKAVAIAMGVLAAGPFLRGKPLFADIVEEWIGGSGSWSNPNNWSGGVVPGSTSDVFDVYIDSATPLTVNLTTSETIGLLAVSGADSLYLSNGGSLTTGSLDFIGGSITLDPASPNNLDVTGSFDWTGGSFEYNQFALPPNLVLGPGMSLLVNGAVIFPPAGNLSVSGGTLACSGVILSGGTLTLNSTSSMLTSYGAFDISGGTFNWTAGTLSLQGGVTASAANIGANPTLSLGQTLQIWSTFYLGPSSDMTLDGGTLESGTGEVLGNGGDGRFVQNSGINNGALSLDIAVPNGSPGTFTYLLYGGTVTAYIETIGAGPGSTGIFSQHGGLNFPFSELNVGSISTAGTGTGSYLIHGGSLTTQYVFVQAGTFFQSGGTVSVNGFSIDATTTQTSGISQLGQLAIGYNASDTASNYALMGGTLVAGTEIVGYYGSGALQQSAGLHRVTGTLVAGDYPSTAGTLVLSGGTLAANTGQIGYWGTGAVNQSAGIATFSSGIILGVQAGGNGEYFLSGGTLTSAGLTIGQAGAGAWEQSGGVASLGPVSGTGTLGIMGGSAIAPSLNIPALALGGTGRLQLSGGSTNAASLVSSLNFSGGPGDWNGQLDITDKGLIVESTLSKASEIAILQDEVNSGRNGGTWTGMEITSSCVAADAAAGTNNSFHTTVEIFDNGALPVTEQFTSFGGQAVDANSILITRALVGDANLDGTVDNTDLVALLTHFGESGQTQATGDYNGDGTVNNTDLVALLTDYGQSLPGDAADSGGWWGGGCGGGACRLFCRCRRRGRCGCWWQERR